MSPFLAATGPDIATFVICAVIVLSGAIGVITSRNAVHAALSLVMTLFGVAVLFIEQHAYFLAAVQVIVYAGAIVVLFLFVIMFLGVDRRENIEYEPLKGQRPLALVFIVIALGSILALAATANWVTGAHAVSGSLSAGHHTDTYQLGKAIFTTYLWPFEITAALLVIAVVGAVVLARRPTRVHETAEGAGAMGRSPGSGDAPDGGAPGADGALGEAAVADGTDAARAGASAGDASLERSGAGS